MKRLLIIMLMVFPLISLADLPANPVFQWTPPTEFTDNTPLNPATDLSGYQLRCDGDTIVQDITGGDTTSWTAPSGLFPRGDHSCVMTAISSDGISSAPSDPKAFAVQFPPNAITFTVQ